MTGSTDLPLVAIAGAPKCGTTALAEALKAHRQVLFSNPKEPYFFGSDLEPLRRHEGITTPERYEACFALGDRNNCSLRCEATTLYMSSPDALDQLIDAHPEARVICMVRNPIDVSYAFHMQMLFAEFEDIVSFPEAWRAQQRRRQNSPPGCPVPRLLQYQEIASLGTQLARAMSVVQESRLHIVVYDDLVSQPARSLARIAQFLGLDPTGLTHLPRANSAMRLRSPRLARLLRSNRGRRVAQWASANMPAQVAGPLKSVKSRLLRAGAPRERLQPALLSELSEVFEPEIQRLEEILNRPLRAWRNRLRSGAYESPPAARR